MYILLKFERQIGKSSSNVICYFPLDWTEKQVSDYVDSLNEDYKKKQKQFNDKYPLYEIPIDPDVYFGYKKINPIDNWNGSIHLSQI